MKRLIVITLSILAISSAVRAQSLEPPVVSIFANRSVVSPNEITLKRGEVVTLRVTSTERVRGFHSKDFGFNVELRPNQPREIIVSANRSGRFVVTGSSPGDFELVINVAEASYEPQGGETQWQN